jgi:hypothetical protein
MAQKLFTDKIGALSHSAGNILMAASISSPAYLTIGGQQYTVTSQLSVALPTMTANTRYQVFAVQGAGVVSLVISLNENSVGPSGYSSWKLVGSLQSNSAATFASFVQIKGMPRTELYNDGPISISATGGGFVKGTTQRDVMLVQRIGNRVFNRFEYNQTGASTAGSGFYTLNLAYPVDPQLDTSTNTTANYAATTAAKASGWGSGTITDGTSRGHMWWRPYDNDSFVAETEVMYTSAFLFGPSGSYPLSTATVAFAGTITYPVNGWSNTPIEDL